MDLTLFNIEERRSIRRSTTRNSYRMVIVVAGISRRTKAQWADQMDDFATARAM